MSTGRTWVLCLAVLLVLALVLGLRAPTTPPADDARLGPENGDPVAVYLQQARASLDDVEDTRWALLSPSAELSTADAARLVAGTRTSQVLLQVPVDRVQTPLTTVAVADQGDLDALVRELDTAQRWAGGALLGGPVPPGRPGRVVRLGGVQLRAGCACIVGLVVRGRGSALREVASRPGVRAVDVAPPGTNYGRLALAPLLPSQTTTVTPGPDDGPVPVG